MTISQAIERADSMCPNLYEEKDKIAWLAELDGKIYLEVILTHEDGEATSFTAYSTETAGNTQLIADDPYAGDIYVWWLIAQTALYNMESAKHNQALTKFSDAYDSWTNWYNRRHMPKEPAGGNCFRW